jgi:hypothetical protein
MKKLLLNISILLVLTNFVAQGQNINLSNGFVFEGEPFLSVNPQNSQHLVLAWMGYDHPYKVAIYYRVSFDGGNIWSTKTKIQQSNNVFSAADPTMDFDDQGNVFLAYCEFVNPPVTTDSGGIFIRKSTNGGLTWNPSVKVMDLNSDIGKKAIDRPWLRIDRSGGVNNGNIYITSMNMKGVTTTPFNPYLHRSFDGGNTWVQWKYLDAANWLAGIWIPHPVPTPDISGNGKFHAVYPSYVFTQSPYIQYIHVYSSDGGNTLSHNSVFFDITNANDTLSKKGYLLRANPSDTNHLVLFHISNDNGDLDIFMRESQNEGVSWSNALRINDDPIANNRMQDLVWADFDDDGDLFVAWRDRRNAPDSTFTTSSEIWGAIKWKDSTVFSPNFLISDSLVPYDTILGATSGNDFMSVQFANDTIYSVWGSNRDGALNIWFQKMTFSGTTSIIHINQELNNDILIYPNPASGIIHINTNNEKIKSIKLFNVQGQLIQEYFTNEFSIANLPNGIYFVTTQTDKTTFTNKLIKQ